MAYIVTYSRFLRLADVMISARARAVAKLSRPRATTALPRGCLSAPTNGTSLPLRRLGFFAGSRANPAVPRLPPRRLCFRFEANDFLETGGLGYGSPAEGRERYRVLSQWRPGRRQG